MGKPTQVLVGLNRVGLVGLREAFAQADASASTQRDVLVDVMMQVLSEHNYIPASSLEAYHKAVWREYQRFKNQDIRHLYSEIEVCVRADPGEETDHFIETLASAFAEHELKPVATLMPPDPDGPNPQLWIGDEAIIKGATRLPEVKRAVAKQITDW